MSFLTNDFDFDRASDLTNFRKHARNYVSDNRQFIEENAANDGPDAFADAALKYFQTSALGLGEPQLDDEKATELRAEARRWYRQSVNTGMPTPDDIKTLERLLKHARGAAVGHKRGGTWKALLETVNGNEVVAAVSIELFRDTTPRIEAVEFFPRPDVMITDSGDYFEDDELEDLCVDADLPVVDAFDVADVIPDRIEGWDVKYEEDHRAKRLAQDPVWLTDDQRKELKAALRQLIAEDQ